MGIKIIVCELLLSSIIRGGEDGLQRGRWRRRVESLTSRVVGVVVKVVVVGGGGSAVEREA